MSFEIDPSFKRGRAKARTRQRKRLALRLGGGIAALVLLVGMTFLLIRALGGEDRLAQNGDPDAMSDDFAMVQTEGSADPVVERDPSNSFIHLRRDPMILRLAQSATTKVRQIAGPAGFVPARAGPDSASRISVLGDSLFVTEKRLITTLPSSRDDFALFQAQRSQAIAEMQQAQTESRPAVPVAAGERVTIEEESSWGAFISDDATREDNDHGHSHESAAVYVETRIENTTSMVVAQRESRRQPLYEDAITVLRADRELSDILTANGFAEDTAALIVRAVQRQLNLPTKAPKGGVVALRMRNAPEGRSLMQISIYGPEGYLATLAQIGAGRFASAADPWVGDDLMSRSDQARAEALNAGDVRLLDALYSAAIRNGLPTKLVGEIVVVMSKLYDLDRFVTQGDKLTVLFASTPGPDGAGLGQVLFVGIKGPSGDMPCYVIEADTTSGYGCFDANAIGGGAGVAAQGLSGGMIVPVKGVRTSGFGPRHHPILKQVRNHNGLDWAAPTGTPVHAAGPGKIAVAGNGGGYGNVVYIDHPGGVQTRYAHLNKFAPGIAKGKTIAAGALIGYVGTTGRSTGPHLHFELRINGQPVDPLTYAGVSSGGQPGSSAVEALVNKIIKVESAGNARAKNPLSSATGLGQFIESTWLRMMRDYRPDLFRSMNRAQLLDLRYDPALSREMVRNLARENESFLRARGHQITAGRLYLAHFLGPAGANTALRADPSATVLAVMGAGVVNANPFLRGKTIGDLRAWSDRKMRGASGKGGTVVAVTSAPAVRTIPPEVKAFRKTVDQILTSL